MNDNDPKKPSADKDQKKPVHPSGLRPTVQDAESRMTSEGNIDDMDESQAGRMGEGVRSELPRRRDSVLGTDRNMDQDNSTDQPGADEEAAPTAEPPGAREDRERPGSFQNRHGDRGGSS
jgi:hypothetical protein